MGENGSDGDVQIVGAPLLKPPANLDRFLQPGPWPVPRIDRVVEIGGVDLDPGRESLAHFRPNRSHHLAKESGAVFQGAAVVVRARIDGRAEKLGKQVPVGRVKFDPVQTRLPGPPRPIGEPADNLPDLIDAHLLTQQSMEPVGPVRRRPGWRHVVLNPRQIALTTGMAELQDVLAVVVVHSLADGAPGKESYGRNQYGRSSAGPGR